MPELARVHILAVLSSGLISVPTIMALYVYTIRSVPELVKYPTIQSTWARRFFSGRCVWVGFERLQVNLARNSQGVIATVIRSTDNTENAHKLQKRLSLMI